jgi:hypothetical protein
MTDVEQNKKCDGGEPKFALVHLRIIDSWKGSANAFVALTRSKNIEYTIGQ